MYKTKTYLNKQQTNILYDKYYKKEKILRKIYLFPGLVKYSQRLRGDGAEMGATVGCH